MSIGRFTINNSGEKLNSILKEDVDGEFNVLQAEATAHIANLNNPHVVTKNQVGLGNVDNVKQASATDLIDEETARKQLEYYGDSSVEPSDCFDIQVERGFGGDFGIVVGFKQGATIPFEQVIPYEIVENEVTYLVEAIAENAFKDSPNISNLRLPKTIWEIESSAFMNSDLNNINLENVDNIEVNAFKNTSLWECELSKTLNSFGSYISQGMFENCTYLSKIYIPGHIESIQNNAFNGCTSLTTIYFGGTKEQWNAITVGTGNDVLSTATIYYDYTTIDASDISSAISAHNNSDMAHYETITLPLEALIDERMIDKGYFKPEDVHEHYPFSVGNIYHIEETQDSTTTIEITHNYSVGKLNISTTSENGVYSFSGGEGHKIFSKQQMIIGSIIKVGTQEIRVVEIDYDNETIRGDVELSYTDEPVSTIYVVPAIAVQAGDVIEWTTKGFYKFVNPDDAITTSYIDSLFS